MEKLINFLIVDDDSDDLEFFCDAVKKVDSKIKCLTLSDGMDALELLKSSNQLPDIIFLDLNMPRMNGKECLKEIKNERRLANIPVVFWSTSKIEEDVDELIKLGAVYFIKKPVFLNILCEEIKTVLNEIKAREADSVLK